MDIHNQELYSDKVQEEITQLVCFKLAEEQYAVEIINVQEVVRIQKITYVPQMPEFTLGIINIRGHIIPVFDFRQMFGLEQRPFDEKTKFVVVDIEGTLISFVVDEILDNIKLENSAIDPSPNVKMKINRECLKGVGQLEGRMVVILDLVKINEKIEEEIKLSQTTVTQVS